MLKVTGAAPIAAQRWELGAWSCAAHHDAEPLGICCFWQHREYFPCSDPPFSGGLLAGDFH